MPFPRSPLAKLVAVLHHAVRPGEIHVVLIAIEWSFARCNLRYQRESPRSLWEPFYLPFEKSQEQPHSLRRSRTRSVGTHSQYGTPVVRAQFGARPEERCHPGASSA